MTKLTRCLDREDQKPALPSCRFSRHSRAPAFQFRGVRLRQAGFLNLQFRASEMSRDLPAAVGLALPVRVRRSYPQSVSNSRTLLRLARAARPRTHPAIPAEPCHQTIREIHFGHECFPAPVSPVSRLSPAANSTARLSMTA